MRKEPDYRMLRGSDKDGYSIKLTKGEVLAKNWIRVPVKITYTINTITLHKYNHEGIMEIDEPTDEEIIEKIKEMSSDFGSDALAEAWALFNKYLDDGNPLYKRLTIDEIRKIVRRMELQRIFNTKWAKAVTDEDHDNVLTTVQ
jgi:hypothetical protein